MLKIRRMLNFISDVVIHFAIASALSPVFTKVPSYSYSLAIAFTLLTPCYSDMPDTRKAKREAETKH